MAIVVYAVVKSIDGSAMADEPRTARMNRTWASSSFASWIAK